MNRRSFIRNIFLTGIGSSLFLPKIIKASFKDTLKYGRLKWEINPEWVNAPYEVRFVTEEGFIIKDFCPLRFNEPIDLSLHSNDEIERKKIPPFILKEPSQS